MPKCTEAEREFLDHMIKSPFAVPVPETKHLYELMRKIRYEGRREREEVAPMVCKPVFYNCL